MPASTTRRWGIVLLVAGALCWAGFAVGLATTRPEDGANIGAGFLLELAVPATAVGIALVAKARGQVDPATAGGPAAGASVRAGWALALAVVPVVGELVPTDATAAGAAVSVTLAAVAVAAVGLARAARRRAASGLATAALVTGWAGVVLAVLGLAGTLLEAALS
jgi:hypothetical protein